MKYDLFNRIEAKSRQIYTQFFLKKWFRNIGGKTIIYKLLKLSNPQNIIIGKNCYIFKGARIETIEKWGEQQYKPEILIEDNVSIEQSLHLTCANSVVIGENTTISARCMITDIDHEYENIKEHIIKQGIIVKETKIGKNCFIGMDVKIMSGATVGDNSVIGANSIVFGEIPAYSVAVGVPAKVIKKYCFITKEWVCVKNKF